MRSLDRHARGLAAAFFFVVSYGLSAGELAAVPDPWVQAVNQNDVVRLARLLDHEPAAIERRGRDGKTALMAAAAAGELSLVQRLLAAGADVHALNDKRASALLYAAWQGNPAVVQTLLRGGVEIEQAATNGWTALTMAAAKGHVEVVRLLLRHGAHVEARDVYGWTPLMRAADLGRDAVVALLLDQGGAARDLVNARGQSALHVAAAAGHTSTYRLLKRRGCDPDRADFAGRTPRAIATLQGIEQSAADQGGG